MTSLDHVVPYKAEYFIAEIAAVCRKIGTPKGSKLVNLKTILEELEEHGVESIYKIRGAKPKGRLKIEIVEDIAPFKAWVTFSPRLTLFVRKSVWQRFLEGHPKEREIIAHEIGHIMLHDGTASRFVGNKQLYLKFNSEGHFAEWQADTFAEHLLIPDEIIKDNRSPEKIAFICNVEEDYADERIGKYMLAAKPVTTVFNESPCENCGEFSFCAEKNPPKCSVCGFTTPKKKLS